jgi:hypothetical protein
MRILMIEAVLKEYDISKEMTLDEFKRIMGDKPILIDVRGAFQSKMGLNGFIYRTL